MAYRPNHRQIYYTSVLPAPTSDKTRSKPSAARKPNEPDRSTIFYVDFDNAFREEPVAPVHFGFQRTDYPPYPLDQPLPSVEIISEVTNKYLSPHLRYPVSLEASHPSTPSNRSPYPHSRFHQQPYPPPSTPHHSRELHHQLNNLHLHRSRDPREASPPFRPDAIRSRSTHRHASPHSSPTRNTISPQYFLVKYLGRTPCAQLSGLEAVRTPIDQMVHKAGQFSSMNDLPTLEVCVNTRGLTLAHRRSPSYEKLAQSRHHSPDRHQHGLIPLDNISYAMHDVKYSRVASCIVLRQSRLDPNETLTECYAFLFPSKDYAHRFTLALREVFQAQAQSSRPSRPSPDDRREGRSPQRHSRARHLHQHHEEKTRPEKRSDRNHLRDSHV